ncbi:ADP-glyceromanno-heptose 6-epimerase [bacterium]|nr:ADP-glyceromanno-heptose 6-epimerase [bacterium]
MIIVTGGAGFIGSAVVSYLNQKGINNIIIVDNLGKTEKWKNLVGKRYLKYLHKDDFFDAMDDVFEIEVPEAIIHLGACSATTELDADYLYSNNTDFSWRLVEWADYYKVRVIYASSAATYGDGSQGYSDDHKKLYDLHPLNMYGYSKHIFDQFAYQSKLLKRICGLKFFNVYGPNEYHKGSMTSVVYNAFCQIKEKGKVELFKSYHPDYADGEQKRDFVYVKDVAKMIYWLLKNPNINGIYNVGSGIARSWNDLAKAVFQALELDAKIEYIDMPGHLKGKYQYFTKAKNSKIIKAGWKDGFSSLEDGVKDYVQNYLVKDKRVY